MDGTLLVLANSRCQHCWGYGYHHRVCDCVYLRVGRLVIGRYLLYGNKWPTLLTTLWRADVYLAGKRTLRSGEFHLLKQLLVGHHLPSSYLKNRATIKLGKAIISRQLGIDPYVPFV